MVIESEEKYVQYIIKDVIIKSFNIGVDIVDECEDDRVCYNWVGLNHSG